MGQNYRKLVDGLNLVPKPSDASTSLGDIEVLSSTSKLYFHNGTVNSEILTGASSSSISNKTLDDSSVFFVDTSDPTKAIKFDAAGTTGTSTTLLSSQTANRILTLPDATDTLVGRATTDTLTNKTINASLNTISNITNSMLSGSAAISNANLASMAAHTFKGNNTGSPSTPLDLTSTQLTAELNLFTNTLQGLVPASGGGTANFLRADGTFATPPNSGGTVTTIGSFDGQAPSANGLVISGVNLFAQSADATHPGMVNNVAQTLSGLKSFSGNIATNSISDISGGLTLSSTSGQNITIQPSVTGRLKTNSSNGIDIAQIPSPTPPAAGFDSLYFKSNDQLYSMNSAGQERPVGSGGGLGINFLTLDTSFQPTNPDNSNFEASLGNWATYNNGGTLAQSLTNNSSVNTIDPNRWFAQSFIPSVSASVNTVVFKLAKSGTISGNMFIRIYNDSAGTPGSVIGTSDAFNSATLTGSLTPTTFTFSTPPALTSGNTYYAVIYVAGVTLSAGNAILVAIDSTNPYPSGSEFVTLNAGASWTSGAPNDLYFDIESTSLPLTLTGGSSSLVMSRTTTVGEVLDGAASLKVVKSAVNSQNQGISSTANVPLGYRGQIISIQFPFKVLSGTLVSGDLGFYIYDITNSQLITPTNNSISSGLMKMTFNMPANTTQIRAGINFDSTSTSALTFSIDDIVIGPQEVVFGPSMTDWQPLSGLTMSGVGTISNSSVMYKQLGDTYTIKGQLTLGTVAASLASINLPSSVRVDFNKETNPLSFTQVGIINQQYAGTNTIYVNSGSGNNTAMVLFVDGISSDKIYIAWRDIGGQYAAENGNSLFTSNSFVDFEFSIPVVGISTNVVQQNATTFNISNYLASGTRVTGTPPTQLGQYRSYLRIANTPTFTETNGAPAISPTVNDGVVIYTGAGYTTGDAANQPTRFEIFIGKNKQFQVTYYRNAGRTGLVDATGGFYVANLAGNVRDTGWSQQYDPTTGILNLVRPLTYLTSVEDAHGVEGEDGTFTTGAGIPVYFDVKISESVIPVQLFESGPVYLKEVFANAVDPGGFAAGVWQTRTLNTIENPQSWVSLSSNQFTLQQGQYELYGTFPAFYVNSHQAKLYDITNSADKMIASAHYSGATGAGVDSSSQLMGILTIGSTTTFEIQHHCQTTKATLGVGVSDQTGTFGVNGVFGQLRIEKLR